MARGRPWTKEEDTELRRLAKRAQRRGILACDVTRLSPPRPLAAKSYHSGLRSFAEFHGRTYAAVRKRASRIGARIYPIDPWDWEW